MIRGKSQFLLVRAELASAELRKLLPLLPATSKGTAPLTFSAASLIVATSFANTLSHSKQFHARDCPVMAKALPLSRVGKEASFASRPCTNCVRERVHYLASVLFCADFEQKCTATQPSRRDKKSAGASSKTPSTKLLDNMLEANFGSLSMLIANVHEFSTSGMSPGRLWIVYNPAKDGKSSGSVNLVSLPEYKVPLTHSLWPLAVINLSEERLCSELKRQVKDACTAGSLGGTAQPPAWSHAARVPSANRPLSSEADTNAHDGVLERVSLRDVQAAVAKRAVDAMNWSFVEEQLAAAVTYYSSPERAQTRHDHRKAEEQLAAVRAMSRLRDSGAVINAADSVTIASPQAAAAATGEVGRVAAANAGGAETPASHAATTVGGEEGRAGPAASAMPSGDEAASTASPPATSAEEAVDRAGEGDASHSDASAPPPPAPSGPVPVQLADGTWEYHYPNGDVTRVRKDGTKVFQTKDLTTTVFANGDTLFEYPNKTSILDRADGVRVTTYADGSKKEERLK